MNSAGRRVATGFYGLVKLILSVALIQDMAMSTIYLGACTLDGHLDPLAKDVIRCKGDCELLPRLERSGRKTSDAHEASEIGVLCAWLALGSHRETFA